MLRLWGTRKTGGSPAATTVVVLPVDFEAVPLSAPSSPDLPGAAAAPSPGIDAPNANALLDGEGEAEPPSATRSRVSKKRIALTSAGAALLLLGGAYTQKDRYSDRFADLSRDIIGDKNTSKVEAWYFSAQDKMDQLKFKVFGASTNPFEREEAVVEFLDRKPGRNVFIDLSAAHNVANITVPTLFRPKPLELPKTAALRESPEQGEGVWSTSGLPRTSPTDVLMAKTFFRPDKTRPYALVGVLLFDSRRIRLNMVGGTADPGGDRGVKGSGTIKSDDMKSLVAAFTGGFKGPHGGFGMVAEGREYRPLRNGLASIAVLKDGSIRMGEWGKTLTWSDEMVGVRQNAVLLVDNCEVSKRTAEGNDTWGYVVANSQDFITWRSAVGLTKDGNLLIAAGNSLSAASLANALWAAGACTAMQLDINSPYVLTSTYFQQPDGSVKAEKFMDAMPDNPNRYFKTQERDFFYVTVDEARSAGYKQ